MSSGEMAAADDHQSSLASIACQYELPFFTRPPEVTLRGQVPEVDCMPSEHLDQDGVRHTKWRRMCA